MLKFKGYCVQNGIKQTEIAKILNSTVQSVNRKMNGKVRFTLDDVKTLCEHFKIPADIFF